MFYKYDFDADFMTMKVTGRAARRSRDTGCVNENVPHLYTSELPITECKKNDLLALVKNGVIPQRHRLFYEALITGDADERQGNA